MRKGRVNLALTIVIEGSVNGDPSRRHVRLLDAWQATKERLHRNATSVGRLAFHEVNVIFLPRSRPFPFSRFTANKRKPAFRASRDRTVSLNVRQHSVPKLF